MKSGRHSMGLDKTEQGERIRISDVLFEHPERTFGSLAPLSSNVRAIEAGLRFSLGLVNLLAIVGPSGWGKSHLLEVVANRLSEDTQSRVPIFGATEFISTDSRENADILILDDVQELFGKKRGTQFLQLLLERRVRAKKPTLIAFTANSIGRNVRSFVPSQRDWQFVQITNPSLDDRRTLCTQIAISEGLIASASIVEIVARHMHGNGRTLTGAFKRLRLNGPEWSSPEATLRGCGLLTPFFADNSSWDLPQIIVRSAEQRAPHFPRASARDLALYTMLVIAGLGEVEVAKYVDLAPGVAYHRSRQFAANLAANPAIAQDVRRFVEMVVLSLATDD